MKKILYIPASIALIAVVACTKTEEIEILNDNTPFGRVIEYTPAPGQFINNPEAGFRNITTPNRARSYAAGRLRSGNYVSLGSFGGRIVVGFGTPVTKSGENDFSISGNQIPTSSEPGIVWVMSDVNGNGLADDMWYELRGSDTDSESTKKSYAVTYSRPSTADGAVTWKDSDGAEGTVPRNMFNIQSSYYPVWISEDRYTLSGTRLESRTSNNGSGDWVNGAFDWGYADNFGSDRSDETDKRKVFFSISNAIDADGMSVELESIDFVKVQAAVLDFAGPLGEVSTEVLGFAVENRPTTSE